MGQGCALSAFVQHMKLLTTIFGVCVANNPDMKEKLRTVSRDAPPRVAELAGFLLQHLEDVAFLSMRELARRAKSDANVVMRLSRALGYAGYDAFRQDVQKRVAQNQSSYAQRAAQLKDQTDDDLSNLIKASSARNLEDMFTAENIAVFGRMAAIMVDAPQICPVVYVAVFP